jgi:8-oxo-dGTP diphosphatase
MRTKDSVRGIIIDNNELLLIKRIKQDLTYYVFPGGGVEEGETFLEALDRELKEEINVSVINPEEIYVEYTPSNINRFYLCKFYDGDFGVSDGPEYTSGEYANKGQYIPVRIPISDIELYNIVPDLVKKVLIQDLKTNKFTHLSYSTDNKKRI